MPIYIYVFMKLAAVVILSVVFLAACGKLDFNVDGQRTRIESYLNGREYDYTYQDGVYKYTYYTEGGRSGIVRGDSVYIYFSGYVFANGPGALFTTNIEEDAVAADMEATAMDFSPQGIKIGGEVIPGIDLGLPGSVEGDSLMLFITNDLAYGDRPMGTLPRGATVAFKIVVDKVVK